MRGSILKRCAHPATTWLRCPHAWSVVVEVGTDPTTGKRRQRWVTVQGSKADAERVRTELLHSVDTGAITATADASERFGAYATRWLDHASTRVRAQTLRRYRSLIHHHVTPVIGTVKLRDLRPAHVQRVIDAMLKAEQSPRSTVQAYRVVHAALRQAVRWQIIGTNPADGVQPPRPARPTLSMPDADTTKKILETAAGTPLEVPVTLAALTGLRRGELLALRWSDIDGDVARITGSLQRDGGKLVRLDPKTDRARRVVALPQRLIELLARHRIEQTERRLRLGVDWANNDLICERGDGGPIDPDSLSHAFARLATSARAPGVRLHDLRHGYATALLRGGVHPKVASEALGHSSTAFTMDTYSHLLPSMQRAAAEAIDLQFGPSA
jgi:integrase